MKRIKLAVIILLAVLIASAGIFLAAYYFKNKTEKEKQLEEDKLVLFDFEDNDVDKIEINSEEGQFVIEYTTADGWFITNTDEIILNDSKPAAIVANMCSLKATKIIEDADPSKYGFDNPIKVTSYIGDEAYTILIGDTTPTYENFYAMKEDSDDVFLIDYSVGLTLSVTKDSLKQTYIYPYMSYDVNHFALWKGGQTDENVLFSMNKDSNNVWSMDKPHKDNSVNNMQIEKFLTDTSKDAISTFVQEGCTEADYSKYGFDNPQYVFEITAGDKTTTIIFGADTGNEDVDEMYGLFVESGQVATFIENEITLLSYGTLDMMNTPVFSADISKVFEIIVNINGKEAVIAMSGDEEAYTFNDINISQTGEAAMSAFNEFFRSFNEAYLASSELAAKPSGIPEISIEYTLTNSTVTVIEYIPVPDSDTYYAFRDGIYTGYVVEGTVIEEIINSYEALCTAMGE